MLVHFECKALSNNLIYNFVPSFVFSIIGVVQMVNKKSGVFTASGMNPGEEILTL